jgi:hypothetical protein
VKTISAATKVLGGTCTFCSLTVDQYGYVTAFDSGNVTRYNGSDSYVQTVTYYTSGMIVMDNDSAIVNQGYTVLNQTLVNDLNVTGSFLMCTNTSEVLQAESFEGCGGSAAQFPSGANITGTITLNGETFSSRNSSTVTLLNVTDVYTTNIYVSGSSTLGGSTTLINSTTTNITGALYIDGTLYTPPSPGVSSVTGTANQITASPSTGAVTLSLPSTLVGISSISSTGDILISASTGHSADLGVNGAISLQCSSGACATSPGVQLLEGTNRVYSSGNPPPAYTGGTGISISGTVVSVSSAVPTSCTPGSGVSSCSISGNVLSVSTVSSTTSLNLVWNGYHGDGTTPCSGQTQTGSFTFTLYALGNLHWITSTNNAYTWATTDSSCAFVIPGILSLGPYFLPSGYRPSADISVYEYTSLSGSPSLIVFQMDASSGQILFKAPPPGTPSLAAGSYTFNSFFPTFTYT